MARKIKLERMSVELRKGLKIGMEYTFKVNDIEVPGAEPIISNTGEKLVGAPEILAVERKINLSLPIIQHLAKIIEPLMYYPEDDKGNKEDLENGNTKLYQYGVVSGSILFGSYYKTIMKNPTNKTLVIHSISFPSTVISIELEVNPGLALGQPTTIPVFNTFKQEATALGGVLGRIEFYTYAIPPQAQFILHIHAIDNKTQEIQSAWVDKTGQKYYTGEDIIIRKKPT